jgi:hypothetical protein
MLGAEGLCNNVIVAISESYLQLILSFHNRYSKCEFRHSETLLAIKWILSSDEMATKEF